MGLFGEERFDEGNEWRVDLKNQIEQISEGKVLLETLLIFLNKQELNVTQM